MTPETIAALRLKYATPKPAREDMLAALDEIERLRAGIKAMIAGDEHKPHPTMKDKCVHERWNYDGVCDFCQEEYLQNLLDGEPK